MKICFTLKPIATSYGGGNQFVQNMTKYIKSLNHKVVYNLNDSDVDVIFIIDPRKSPNNRVDLPKVINYKRKHPNVKIIHRVNENDIKRAKPINIEPLLVKTMKIADIVIFVSEWLRNYFTNKYNLSLNSTSILSGCNRDHFYPKSDREFNFKNRKIKIVTHHWSSNYLKGFYIYEKLCRNNIEFIFVGNWRKESPKPKNITLIDPKNGSELGDILRKCDIYLTATQNEPGGMHYLEGVSCGLPILYRKGGGGAHEICCKFGLEFDELDDMFDKLDLIMNNYEEYVDGIDYEYLGSERCCKEYYAVIEKVFLYKNSI